MQVRACLLLFVSLVASARAFQLSMLSSRAAVPATSPAARALQLHLVMSAAPEEDSASSLLAFMDDCLSSEEAARQASMIAAVNSWWAVSPERAQANSDALTRLMTNRGVDVQTKALAAHERGEDTAEASKILQTLVDMTFHVKILVRDLKKASDSST